MNRKERLKFLIKQELPFALSVPILLWQLLFLYIPLITIALFSVMQACGNLFCFTLEHYKALIQPMYFLIIGRSLVLAGVTAFVCLLCAYPVAYCLALRVKRFKNLFLFFLILPFWTNFLVQVYAWFFILGKHGLINDILIALRLVTQPVTFMNSTFAVYVVMVYCYLPFMVMPLYAVLEKFDQRLLEASHDLGANRWRTFWRITVPLTMSGIRTGFFLVFVPAFGEFAVPALLGGGKKLYVGSLISHYIVVAQEQHIGSAFTLVSGLVLVLLVMSIYWFVKKNTHLHSMRNDHYEYT